MELPLAVSIINAVTVEVTVLTMLISMSQQCTGPRRVVVVVMYGFFHLATGTVHVYLVCEICSCLITHKA